jgi:predicted nucleic acid-binding protein
LTPVVIDASFALALALPDEDSELADRLIDEVKGGRVLLVAPLNWAHEALNGLLNAFRRRRIDETELVKSRSLLLALPVEMTADIPDPEALFDLAKQEQITVYDARYFALAKRLMAPLATSDSPLGRAAEKREMRWRPDNRATAGSR